MVKATRKTFLLTAGAGLFGLISSVGISLGQANSRKRDTSNMDVQMLSDRAEIIDTVNKIGLMADLRDWQGCRACFTDKVNLDYSSLGAKPETIAADALMERWKTFFANTFKATQHSISNHSVTITGNRAICISQFQAYHVYKEGSKIWKLGGVYQHQLMRTPQGWQVSDMKMTSSWEEGERP